MPTFNAFLDLHPGTPRAFGAGLFRLPCPSCQADSYLISVGDEDDPVFNAFCDVNLGGRVAAGNRELGCERWQVAAALNMTEVAYEVAMGKEPPEDGGKEPRVSTDSLVEWIQQHYRIGRSTDGLLFGVPTFPGSARVAREIAALKSEVQRRYRDEQKARTGVGVVLGKEMVTTALDTVAAYAEDEHEQPVSLRAAQIGDDRVVLDLGDPTGAVVEVTAAGWQVVEASEDTPLFRRSRATRPLPVPVRGGDLAVLRELLSLPEGDPRWLLIRGWLAAVLFSEIPRPILWATGPQGSGKSTRVKMVLSLIEPTEELGKEPGRNERDDSTSALGRYLVSWDNVTNVSQNTSDSVCRLVTGVTDDRREMYSNGVLRPVSYRRTGVATSLTLPPGLGSDALERLALVEFERIDEDGRNVERGLKNAYQAALPALLGAILDDVVRVLSCLPEVAGEQHPWPRMADYGQVLLALDRALGLPDDAGHLAAYVASVNGTLAERAADDPFTSAVLSFVQERGGQWSGSAEGLLQALNVLTRSEDLPEWWPRTPRAIRTQLTKATEPLRHAGVAVHARKSNGARLLELRVKVPDRAQDTPADAAREVIVPY